MYNFLDWTSLEALDKLSHFNLYKELWPTKYQNKTLGSEQKSVSIEGYGYIDQENKINIKNTTVYGHNMGIATSTIYPINDVNNLPVFAVEWVVIADNIHLIACDINYINEPKRIISKEFEHLHQEQLKIFPLNREIPEWYQPIMGPHTIYGNSSRSKLNELKFMYSAYLQLYIKELNEKYSSLSSGKEHEKTLQYKKHHYINSPAKRILKSNDNWVDDYLNYYHFGNALIK